MNFLEVQFSLRGQTLPADHGYALYSAIKKILQEQKISSDLSPQFRLIQPRLTLAEHSEVLKARLVVFHLQIWNTQNVSWTILAFIK